MTKVTVHDETPTQTLVKDGKREATVTDARGRSIRLVKPAVLAQFRLVKVLGDLAQNQVYMSMVFPLMFVASIDGEPMLFPTSDREIEVLIQRLDEDGIAAVMTGVQDNFAAVDQEAAAAEVKP